jgi:hypothetical protein
MEGHKGKRLFVHPSDSVVAGRPPLSGGQLLRLHEGGPPRTKGGKPVEMAFLCMATALRFRSCWKSV